MRTFILIQLLLLYMAACSQQGSRHFVQYPMKGYVQLSNAEKIHFKGFSFINGDSLKLFVKDRRANHIQAYTSYRDLAHVRLQTIPIASIERIKENTHALTKGAIAGAVLGFGLGYLYGVATYQDDMNLSPDDNWSQTKTRGALHGIIGTVPVGITGALVGRIVLRKRYVIGGSKEKFTQTLEKIY